MQGRNIRTIHIENCDAELDADITAALERARERGADVHMRDEAPQPEWAREIVDAAGGFDGDKPKGEVRRKRMPDWAQEIAVAAEAFADDHDEFMRQERKIMRRQMKRARKDLKRMRRLLKS